MLTDKTDRTVLVQTAKARGQAVKSLKSPSLLVGVKE